MNWETMSINIPSLCRCLLVLFVLSLLFACGGAEDGDLLAPAITFKGSPGTTTNDPNATVTLTGEYFDRDEDGLLVPGGQVTISATAFTATTVSDPVYPGGNTGDWSVSVSNLVEGVNSIAIEAADSVGNTNILTIFVILDITGPAVSFDQYRTPTLTTSQVLAGTVGELGAKVQFCIEDGVNICNPLDSTDWTFVDDVNANVWFVDYDFLADNTYNVFVRGCDQTKPLDTDNCGNYTDEAAYATAEIIVDTVADPLTAPQLAITTATPPSNPIPGFFGVVPYFYPTPDDTLPVVTIDGTRETDYVVSSSVTSGSVTLQTPATSSDWTAVFSGFASGVHRATVSIDNVDGTDPAVANVLIVRDLTPASIVSTTPANGETVSAAATTAVRVVFSESMDPGNGNIDVSNISFVDSTGNVVVPSSVAVVDANDREYEFQIDTTNDPLQAGETYKATLSGDGVGGAHPVADLFGNVFAADYNWTFFTN
ncbi:MAG: hypothetical protein C0623_10000 [Desulfuromonas sp.]|nr:MAG: hypothetical protein C0623_10000 [Desulfuromonas sp.]